MRSQSDFDEHFQRVSERIDREHKLVGVAVPVMIMVWVAFVGLIGTGLFLGVRWLWQNTN